jgi:NarL family two-component system response regulator LiaR
MLRFLSKNRELLLYGVLLALLLFGMRWLEYRFLILDHAMDLYVGFIAVIFTALGIWLAIKLIRPKTIVVEKQVFVSDQQFQLNEQALENLGISRRELEVLALMSQGLSNQEIGAKLFLSLNTIKTHSARLFEKLEVKRRTQAIEKAKRLGLIPYTHPLV